jgi:hypothetical protein
MTRAHSASDDPRIREAIDALREIIRARYPDAAFDVYERDDPVGVHLLATVDIDDTDEVMDLVLDKLYEIQVEQELPVYVVTAQPLTRVARQLRGRKSNLLPASVVRTLIG